MIDTYDRIMRERRRVPKSKRTKVVACVVYRCKACGVRAVFDVCAGVIDPMTDQSDGFPVPTAVVCPMCEGEMTQEHPFAPLNAKAHNYFPSFRVPSRRAAIKIARAGLFEAQLVLTEDRIGG